MLYVCLRKAFDTTQRMSSPILTETPPDDLPHCRASRQVAQKAGKRYQTSQDLLLDLKSLSRELEFSEQAGRVLPQTNEVTAFATGALTTRRFSLLHTLAILLLVGLALGAVWWFAFLGNALPQASLKTAEVATC